VESGCYFHPSENYPHEVEISTNLVEKTIKNQILWLNGGNIYFFNKKDRNIHLYAIETHPCLPKGGLY